MANKKQVKWYVSKFKDKMGRGTTLSTAMAWVEGANVNYETEMEIKRQVQRFLIMGK